MRPLLSKAVFGFCLVWLAIQIGVPTYGLQDPGNARFSWGMYATYHPIPKIDVENADGSIERDVALKFIAVARNEVDYARLLPPHICRVRPGARRILVQPWGQEDWSLACR